ncbi:MAG: hypothetical protein QF879_20760 [Candidatus Latescibacteria bacterium]|nr:hypothetical protein [Candidatus Latescibacterota bacterium]MDP7235764.1 hypothetical protein [Candidatus Latescibacterota bacterium]
MQFTVVLFQLAFHFLDRLAKRCTRVGFFFAGQHAPLDIHDLFGGKPIFIL